MHELYEESITKSYMVPNMMAILGVQKFRSKIGKNDTSTEIPTAKDCNRNDIESLEIISNDENFSTDSNLYESIGEISKISELETQNEDMNRRLESLENILHQTNDEQKDEKGNLVKKIAEINVAQNGTNTSRMIENCEDSISLCSDSICKLNEKMFGNTY